LLLAISDNGSQMRSHSTREFLAGVAIAQQFGRPGTPQDQAWVETLFGHVKGEWPHLEKITDPGELEAELELVSNDQNLWMSLGESAQERAHLPEDDLQVEVVLIKSRRWRAGSGRYAHAHGSSRCRGVQRQHWSGPVIAR